MATPDTTPKFTIKLRDFESQILYFNGMYNLPTAPYPMTHNLSVHEAKLVFKKSGVDLIKKAAIISRLISFKKILLDELNEVDEIIEKAAGFGIHTDAEYLEIDFLTDMADWLGDIQIYCASEMAKYGIPLKETLKIIMQSNFSKLDGDGQPIYDNDGKVRKGPFYWKPEPELRIMLEQTIKENKK